MQFKVGDRVEYTREKGGASSFLHGLTGEVTKVEEGDFYNDIDNTNDIYIIVRWDEAPSYVGQECWVYGSSISLLAPKKMLWEI